MIRRVSFIKRKAGLSDRRVPRTLDGAPRRACPPAAGLARLALHARRSLRAGGAGWDGLGESWFDSIADFDRAFATEPLRTALFADREKCIGDSQSCYRRGAGGIHAARRDAQMSWNLASGLEGKRVMVTGAAGGIGREVALGVRRGGRAGRGRRSRS